MADSRSRTSAREYLLMLGFIVAGRVAAYLVDDIQTGGWQHSSLRFRILDLRERSGIDDIRDRLRFRQAVKITLDNLDTTEETAA